jgi:hypothetical protein
MAAVEAAPVLLVVLVLVLLVEVLLVQVLLLLVLLVLTVVVLLVLLLLVVVLLVLVLVLVVLVLVLLLPTAVVLLLLPTAFPTALYQRTSRRRRGPSMGLSVPSVMRLTSRAQKRWLAHASFSYTVLHTLYSPYPPYPLPIACPLPIPWSPLTTHHTHHTHYTHHTHHTFILCQFTILTTLTIPPPNPYDRSPLTTPCAHCRRRRKPLDPEEGCVLRPT